MSLAAVARVLGVDRRTVWRWRKAGHIDTVDIAPPGSGRPVLRVRQSQVTKLLGGARV
jgi:predicted site-specific integrase-resolvase